MANRRYPRSVEPPPRVLDGATVVATASLDGATATGKTRHEPSGPFAHLALARYDDAATDWYLFYCDEEWRVVNDTAHATRLEAEQQAAFEFAGVVFRAVE